jgi:type III secretion protein J
LKCYETGWSNLSLRSRRDFLKYVSSQCRGLLHTTLLSLILICALAGCDEQILHDLSEQEANRVVSRLGASSLSAKKIQQSDGRWAIAVSKESTVTALSFLETNRVLAPRGAAGATSGKGGFVPSREEQWFRYERSVALSIEDSLSTVLGVLEARVHLNLPETDPLFGTRKESIGSGSVLLVVDENYTSKDEEISALVAGAAGIPATKVTVLRSPAQVVAKKVGPEQGMPAPMQVSQQPVAVVEQPVAAQDRAFRPELGVASCAAVALLCAGTLFCVRRRRRVKFPLPRATDHED